MVTIAETTAAAEAAAEEAPTPDPVVAETVATVVAEVASPRPGGGAPRTHQRNVVTTIMLTATKLGSVSSP